MCYVQSTHFYRIREEGGSGRPPTPYHSFENRWCNIDILLIILKGIVRRFRFSLNFSTIFWFRDFMEKFSGNDSPMASEWVSEKFQTFKIWIYYIYSFWICNYFREIFKFHDFMDTLRNFAKFKYLLKRIIRNLEITCFKMIYIKFIF